MLTSQDLPRPGAKECEMCTFLCMNCLPDDMLPVQMFFEGKFGRTRCHRMWYEHYGSQ